MIGIDHTDELAPGGVLIASERDALIKRCLADPDERKRRARDRWLVYTEQHGPLIVARLNKTLSDPSYRDEVIKHLDLSDNPALDAIHDTCAVWSQGPSRSVAGASQREASTFNALVVESLVDVHGQQWNELAEFVGPILVLPAVRKEQLRWDVLLPTFYDVVPDPEDYYGVPLAAAWPIRGTGGSGRKPDVMVLDGFGWSRWRTEGGSTKQVGETIEHGLGRFPGVPLRFDAPLDCDYFGQPSRHQRFVDATVATGAINSVLSLTRKAQNSKLLTAIGPLGNAVKEQALDPETGVAINIEPGPGVALPEINALDFDTPPDNSIKHIDKYRRGVAAAYGGSLAADGRMVFDTKALAEVRKKQIPRGRVFERVLWINAVELCRKMGHPLAPQLPDATTVAAGFAVDFGQLSREFSDPRQEHEHEDWMISKGLKDQLDLLRQQGNENLDDDQLKKKLEANLENQAWFNDAVTKRNLSMNAAGVQTAPQAFGALGPMVRDAADQPAPEGAPAVPEGTTP